MELATYHSELTENEQNLCAFLRETFDRELTGATARIWHAHPVWFIDGNPVAGYSSLKDGIRVLFWSGQSFETLGLRAEGKFKAAEIRIRDLEHCKQLPWSAWLQEALQKQWDYKNIVKRKGQLLPLTKW